MASDGTVIVSGRFLIGRPIEGLANSNQNALSQARASSMNRENIPRGRTTSVRGDADIIACCVNRRVVRKLLVRWTIFRPAASAYVQARLKGASYFVIRGSNLGSGQSS